MTIKKGVTRIVFVFKKFVIKIPNFTYSHGNFLSGCSANWDERKYTKAFYKCKDCNWNNKVAPTYYSSWFGLLNIQPRVKILNRDLTEEEIIYFKESNIEDLKSENFGYLNNKLVCIDYA